MFSLLLALAAPVAEGQVGEPMTPATDPGSWATTEDYPAAALRDEREGITGFRLTIAPDGLPRQCEIISRSGHDDLDTTTCRLIMERARFRPGRDEKGARVGGTYSNRIRWQIPDDYLSRLASAGFSVDETRDSWPRGPSPLPATLVIDTAPYYPPAALAARHEGDVHMAVSVDALGKVTGCSVIVGSMSGELDQAACRLMRSQGEFRPALDAAGKPTKGVIPAVFRWFLPRGGAPADGEKTLPGVRKFPMSEEGTSAMSVMLDADGKASECTYSKSGETWLVAPNINPCDTIGGARRYIPFVDADGKPVAKRVTLRIEATIEAADAVKLPVSE